MTLKKFLESTGISISKFSEATGINANTLFTYVHRKSEPTVSNAIKIIDASHGAIDLRDLAIKKPR